MLNSHVVGPPLIKGKFKLIRKGEDKGEQQKSDLENQGQIWYSLGFEELGLGFDGE